MQNGLSILTLSGWAQPADALISLFPHAEYVDYGDAASVKEVAERINAAHYDLVIGWSLGGMIARRLLNDKSLSANALVLLASPYQFVANQHVSDAMGPTTFGHFVESYRTDPKRTSARFHGLIAKDDAHEKEVIRQLSQCEDVSDAEIWLRWLGELKDYSSHDVTYQLPPTLVMHGKKDAIVPPQQVSLLANKTNADVVWLDQASHAPHLHDAALVTQHITDFYKRVVHD